MLVSHQCDVAMKQANVILGCTKEGILIQINTSTIAQSPFRPNLELNTILWLIMLKKDDFTMKQVQRRVARMIRGMESRFYEKTLKELGLFSLAKCILRGNVIVVYKYIIEVNITEGEKILKLEDNVGKIITG